MNCQEICEFLFAYHANELPADQHEAFTRHLERCPPCLAYLRKYATVIEAGKRLREPPQLPEMPEKLVRAILAARAAQGPSEQSDAASA